MTTRKEEQQGNPAVREEPVLTLTIDKITYVVGIHFNESSTETLKDKIDRMIRRDIQTGAA